MKKKTEALSLCDWIFEMVIDIAESRAWEIEYRYVYYDRASKAIDIRRNAAFKNFSVRYHRLDACIEPETQKIYIAPDATDKALCLFHECLEILFSDWKEDYFCPKRWRLEDGDDPIRYLESVTWARMSRRRKNQLQRYLPKEPPKEL